MKRILTYFMIISLFLGNISGCSFFKAAANSSTVESSDSVQDEQEAVDNSGEAESESTAEDEKSSDADVSQDSSKSEQNNTAQNQKIVVIDPGHGNHSNLEKEKQSPDSDIMKIKDGGGAEGISTKTPEYRIAMNVALKLKPLLEAENIKVVMTKTEDSESPGNIERAQIANECNAALEIRIHCDSSDNQNAYGLSMLVPDKCGYASAISDTSRQYGQVVLDNVINSTGAYNRGIITRDDLTGFNWSKVPVILVEMGFLSNPSEDKKLNSDDYQNKLAQGLKDGIVKAIK